jgi:hypothetical protein
MNLLAKDILQLHGCIHFLLGIFSSDWFIIEYIVRNVISGSPDRETDPIRALIGGACRVWQWTPSHAASQ